MNSRSKNMQSILDEAIEETSEHSKNLDAIFMSSQNLLESTKTGLIKVIEHKCSNELNWLKANFDKSKTVEYEKRVEEMNKCSAKNDFGLSDFLKTVGDEERIISERDQNCLKNCNSRESNDVQLKNCFKSCLMSSYEGYNSLVDKITIRMNEINKLL